MTGSRAATREESRAIGASLWRSWGAVVSLGVGIFVLVTIEELPIGVLTLMADDLRIAPGLAGLSVTLPGIVAAVTALLTPVIARGLDRRLVLVLALASVVVSCTMTVLSGGLGTLLASRVFAGVAIGLYWTMLPVVAVRQVRPGQQARALTVAFAGNSSALVLGVPLASWVGAQLGWREAFIVVGVAAAAVLVAQMLLVRPVHAEEQTRLSDLAAGLRTRGVRFAVCLTALVITGQFTTYGYVSPLLQSVVGIRAAAVPGMLLAFGIAGLAGNFAVAPLLRRSPGVAVALIAGGMAASIAALGMLVHAEIAAVVLMAAWGLFAGASSVSIQTFVTRYSGRFEETGTALNSAMFNVAIAGGAFVGGRLLDAVGIGANLVVSGVLLLGAVVVALRWLLSRGHEDAAPRTA